MRNKHIFVDQIRFYAYTKEEQTMTKENLWMYNFTFRHDFLFSSDLAGVAVRIDMSNTACYSEHPRGARRKLKLTLVDTTDRAVVYEKEFGIYFTKTDPYGYNIEDLPLSEVPFKGGHSYKIIVSDPKKGWELCADSFTFYDAMELGNPKKWYTAERGYVKLSYDSLPLRAIKQCDITYYATFKVRKHFGELLPVLPELEICIFPPEEMMQIDFYQEPTICRSDSEFLTVQCEINPQDYLEGIFYAELRCMGHRIAGFVFRSGDKDEAGDWTGDDLALIQNPCDDSVIERYETLTGTSLSEEPDFGDDFDDEFNLFNYDLEPKSIPAPTPVDGEPLLASLDHLTGLRGVKAKLTTYERVVRFNKMRADSGLPTSDSPLHAMFLGSPGTGKTTVAKLMGKMLRRAGILSRGHVVERERANLLGQNYNSEAEKTMEAIEEAQGGILFIDEAYSLYQPNDARDPGKFVIETLLTALADESKRDWMLILAGYPDEMKRLFEMNPGFSSRIPQSNIYTFDDFSEAELMDIAENYLTEQQYTLSPEARQALSSRLCADYAARDAKFGNARHVLNLITTEILPAMAIRVTESATPASLTEILPCDIPAPIAPTRTNRRIGYSA